MQSAPFMDRSEPSRIKIKFKPAPRPSASGPMLRKMASLRMGVKLKGMVNH